MLKAARHVIVMEPQHTEDLLAGYPEISDERISLLVDFSPGPHRPCFVPDPIGLELWAYQASYGFIDACIRGMLARMGI
jgi:protein-tyrosine-phosphatase